MIKPREDRLEWDDHHMLLALVTAQRSADPNTQVGACIVNRKNKVLGVGYNGPPKGISPHKISWEREDKHPHNTKYPFIVHAEKNAIYNSNESVADAILFVTMYPCNECAKDIIQANIKEVIWLTNPYIKTWQCETARWMFDSVDIKQRQHKWSKKVKLCMSNIFPLVE